MRRLPFGVRARQFARLLLLQATWSFERMQGLGLAWALEPWLKRVYRTAAERRAALQRHAEYFNTQPYVASLILGLVCALEEDAAALPPGQRPAAFDRIRAVKNAMASSLAGAGDAFFWGALRPAAAAAAVLAGTWTLARGGRAGLWMAGTYLIAYNAPALWLRWRGIALGYEWREQLPTRLKKLRVQTWVNGTRAIGAALALVLLVTLAAQADGEMRIVGAGAVVVAWLAYTVLPSRVNALRLYGAGCAAGLIGAVAGWL